MRLAASSAAAGPRQKWARWCPCAQPRNRCGSPRSRPRTSGAGCRKGCAHRCAAAFCQTAIPSRCSRKRQCREQRFPAERPRCARGCRHARAQRSHSAWHRPAGSGCPGRQADRRPPGRTLCRPAQCARRRSFSSGSAARMVLSHWGAESVLFKVFFSALHGAGTSCSGCSLTI